MTEQSDHQNCVIGAHTHNIQLPESKQKELGEKLGFMSEIGYIRMEDVAKIPQVPFHPKDPTRRKPTRRPRPMSLSLPQSLRSSCSEPKRRCARAFRHNCKHWDVQPAWRFPRRWLAE